MSEQDTAREAAWQAWAYEDGNWSKHHSGKLLRSAFDAGVAHGRAEAWREIEIITGDALPRDWGRIAREVREVRDVQDTEP